MDTKRSCKEGMLKQLTFFLIITTSLGVNSFFLMGDDTGTPIVTAVDYFDEISRKYVGISDYQANVDIHMDESVMTGVMIYKPPDLLRIDFSKPEEQVIVSDGEQLTIYIPRYRVVMSQKLDASTMGGPALNSGRGLRLLKENYGIAYVNEKYVPLDDEGPGALIHVKKLRLNRRNTKEGFTEIILAVDEDGFIRRITGTTISGKTVRFDFNDIQIDKGIPSSEFEYTPPPSANNIDNFLFDTQS